MRIGGVPASLIVDARITSVKAGIEMSANDLEAHYLLRVTSSRRFKPSLPQQGKYRSRLAARRH